MIDNISYRPPYTVDLKYQMLNRFQTRPQLGDHSYLVLSSSSVLMMMVVLGSCVDTHGENATFLEERQ